jgi:hypothetical protein
LRCRCWRWPVWPFFAARDAAGDCAAQRALSDLAVDLAWNPPCAARAGPSRSIKSEAAAEREFYAIPFDAPCRVGVFRPPRSSIRAKLPNRWANFAHPIHERLLVVEARSWQKREFSAILCRPPRRTGQRCKATRAPGGALRHGGVHFGEHRLFLSHVGGPMRYMGPMQYMAFSPRQSGRWSHDSSPPPHLLLGPVTV